MKSSSETKSHDDSKLWKSTDADKPKESELFKYIYPQVNAIAKRAKSLKIEVYEDEEILQSEHWLKVLLENPNNQDNKRQFIAQLVSSVVTFPDTFILFHYSGKTFIGEPIEMEVINPARVEIRTSEEGFKGYYLNEGNTKQPRLLDDREIIHLRGFSPMFNCKGYSVIDAIADVLGLARELDKYQLNYFANNAIPAGAFVIEAQASQFKNITKGIINGHQGSKKSGAVQFIRRSPGKNSKMEFIKYQNDNKDLAMPDLWKHINEQIDKSLGVPKEVMGDVENTNRANADAAKAIFLENTVVPIVEDIVGSLNNWLEANFDETVYIDFINPVPEDLESSKSKAEILSINVKTAIDLLGQGVSKDTILELTGVDLGEITPPALETSDRSFTDLKGHIDAALLKATNEMNQKILSSVKEPEVKKKLESKIKATQLPRDLERKYEQELLKELKKFAATLLAQAKGGGIDPTGATLSLFAQVSPTYKEILAESYRRQINRAKKIIQGLGTTTTVPGTTELRFLDAIRSGIRSFVNTGAVTVESILAEGTRLNWTRKQLEKELADYFQKQGPYLNQRGRLVKNNYQYRAERLARTETHRANVRASVEAMRDVQSQTGITIQKIWKRTRSEPEPICDELDGTIIGVEQTFWQAGEARTIGDKTFTNSWQDMEGGDAHIGCACVIEDYIV